ncbi:MAG: phage tail protein [Lachnospiraceae bacterium]|nr:phage tail protein [Lachnospiraceae bacterium]
MDIGDNGVTYLALPPNFHTEENNALCYAADRQLKKLMEAAGNIAVWAELKNTDAKYYDYMAASVRAPYYASQYNDSTRLGILESTFQVYMFAGTRKGVEELVSRVFSGEAVFVPWYGYNGTPYHFRISVHSSPVKDTHNKFKEILRRVKSARSVLDVVEYIISFIIHMPEEMDVTKIRLHTQLNFWGCDILNGTRLLDGSVLVDAKKRYNLVLGINNRLKFSISENIDADRVYINYITQLTMPTILLV